MHLGYFNNNRKKSFEYSIFKRKNLHVRKLIGIIDDRSECTDRCLTMKNRH